MEEKNKDFDNFDENFILSKLKKHQKKKAKAILEQIKEHGDQLTFDKSGVVFIEGNSIPGSNIAYLLYCVLNAKKNAPGYEEFILKLQQLGLSQFIPKKSSSQESKIEIPIDSSPYNTEGWYYLGP